MLRITDRYGTVQDSLCDQHFKTLLTRLVGTPARSLKVVVLDTSDPIALSPGNNTIIVSRGLLMLFTNEAELSFTIAHEAGHYALQHHEMGLPVGGDSSERRDLESEADAFAISAMAQAGYDSSYAVSALTAVYNHVKDRGMTAEYPSLYERISNVATIAIGHGNLGIGTADRRSFHECQLSLRSRR